MDNIILLKKKKKINIIKRRFLSCFLSSLRRLKIIVWEGRIRTRHRPVQEWAKDYSCTNPDLTCGLRSEDGKRTDPPSKEPKE